MKYLLSLIIVNILTGCVGLTVSKVGKAEYEIESFTFDHDFKISSGTRNKSYSVDEVMVMWGKPTLITEEGLCSVYHYHSGYVKSGLFVYLVVVPLPLTLPVEKRDIKVHFRGGQSVKVSSEKTEETFTVGFMCGELECSFLFGNVAPFTGLKRTRNTVARNVCG